MNKDVNVAGDSNEGQEGQESDREGGGVINTLFLKRLLASPAGRSFMLSYLLSTEEADEGMVFENLLARIDDPALHRMAKIHADDEVRHARIFRNAVERIGVDVPSAREIPPELHIVARIDRLLGGFSAKFAAKEIGVMEVYVLLQVIEERAVREWPHIAEALFSVDPQGAADVVSVIRDERRHVKYAKAISRRYAPDAATLARTLRHYRAVEQQAFDENSQAMMRIILERELLVVGSVERIFWKSLSLVGKMHMRMGRSVIKTTVATTSAAACG